MHKLNGNKIPRQIRSQAKWARIIDPPDGAILLPTGAKVFWNKDMGEGTVLEGYWGYGYAPVSNNTEIPNDLKKYI